MNHPKLSPRLEQALRLFVVGHTAEEVAQRMGISKHTARGYREQLLKISRCPNTVAMVTWAIRNGYYAPKTSST